MFGILDRKVSFRYEVLATTILIITTWVFFYHGGHSSLFLLISVLLGLYMAINIGANDIPNNIGPAVGSGAINAKWAIILAALFEAFGAILAGGGNINTISKGIINPSLITDPTQFIAIMVATLTGAAIWVNVATFLKAPVSATQSIIGGLVGAGISAIGFKIINWSIILKIAVSWLLSPFIGGIIAAIILLSIRHNIFKKDERGEAAKVWVPIYIGMMAWLFSTYLILKGLHNFLEETHYDLFLRSPIAIFIGYVLGILVFVFLRIYYKKQSSIFKDSKKFVNKLFNIPLIFAVSLLSFAHGANDVANAVGPIAAINNTINSFKSSGISIQIESWIMVIGSTGLILGVTIFGSRLVKTVGNEITKLNQVRAFSVAISAASTAIFASTLGIPVSLTHITLGSVFGVGLIRQQLKKMKGIDKQYIDISIVKEIALAWIITIPISGIIAGLTYFTIIKIYY